MTLTGGLLFVAATPGEIQEKEKRRLKYEKSIRDMFTRSSDIENQDLLVDSELSPISLLEDLKNRRWSVVFAQFEPEFFKDKLGMSRGEVLRRLQKVQDHPGFQKDLQSLEEAIRKLRGLDAKFVMRQDGANGTLFLQSRHGVYRGHRLEISRNSGGKWLISNIRNQVENAGYNRSGAGKQKSILSELRHTLDKIPSRYQRRP